jgi:peptidoglycan/LPS O-acetylase OafA/YrhL
VVERTLRSAYDVKSNSIGFLRLLLAGTVLFSHTWILGNFGTEPLLYGPVNIGNIAVCGFFALSGLLITQSVERFPLGRFAWHRALRILPGFWVCLLVVGFGFAPLAYVAQHGSLSGFLSATDGPFHYLRADYTVRIHEFGVSGTPAGIHFPRSGHVWDGSLYTLWPEVKCYIAVGLLAATGLLTRARFIAPLAAMALLLLVHNRVADQLHLSQWPGWLLDAPTSRFGLCFFVGASLWLYRDRVPLSAPLASLALIGVGLLLVTGRWDDGAGVLFSYVMIWAATALPFRKVGRSRDFSYGIYIYAFPTQQALALTHLRTGGPALFMLISAIGATALAVTSWYAVERHALRLKAIAPWSERDPVSQRS